jgi:hypothetical protein
VRGSARAPGDAASALAGATTVSFEIPPAPDRVTSGRYRDAIRVQVYGMLNGCSSIANVSAQYALHLTTARRDVALYSYTGGPCYMAALEEHAYVDAAAPIALFVGVPDVGRIDLGGHETTVAAFVCETDAIPPRWVRTCNRFDLILVPSSFCKQSFVRSGVTTPVMIVPHGLEPEYRPVRDKARADPFVFYDVVNAHVPARKGFDTLVRAFKRAFAGRSDVVLRLRASFSHAVAACLERHDPRHDAPLILIEDAETASTADFAAIYSEVHCTVHPAGGEGFGLVPFQSIACETPVIAAPCTGMADYLDANNAMLLRTREMDGRSDVYYRYGRHPVPDENHLVELLRYAEANWELEYDRVRQIASDFRVKHRWERALADLVALVSDLAELPDGAARRALIQSRVR